MSDPHAADADYRALNGPDEAALARMMDSAVALGAILEGQGRRRVDAEGRGTPIGSAAYEAAEREHATSAGPRRPPFVAPPEPVPDPPRYDETAFLAAIADAAARPALVASADAAVIEDMALSISNCVARLRALPTPDPVVGHALNSIDLGLVGLARAVGDGSPG